MSLSSQKLLLQYSSVASLSNKHESVQFSKCQMNGALNMYVIVAYTLKNIQLVQRDKHNTQKHTWLKTTAGQL